ncbi:DUF3641 domain-containing protein [Microbulbifer rhizosphaerae]|uniref:Radical SAM/Cys-rich protein n=1 Tax=Microbulbifer rhizosphaerae TaxID=1562603 RepID=A0A7W4W916_9GAMM|nr:DUF3641 domain-containing protein [Microbulbifer rhizosphaerae]MBB3059910.1 radical SAM/Cys-rich protein [Microbulbifer rhizosphaerae]
MKIPRPVTNALPAATDRQNTTRGSRDARDPAPAGTDGIPGHKAPLQADYKRALFEHFGIVFNELYALANMPIQRFGSTLISKGQFHDYMRLLKDNHAADNLEDVMCRSLVSVDWRGHLYDCDFNQQLGLALPGPTQSGRPHLRDLLREDLSGRPVRVADHCFGCTAGQGSSCGGAL